jgi:hypothetical protein
MKQNWAIHVELNDGTVWNLRHYLHAHGRDEYRLAPLNWAPDARSLGAARLRVAAYRRWRIAHGRPDVLSIRVVPWYFSDLYLPA